VVGLGAQLAAVVATDLVGSTELRVRIGEDAAERLRRDHDRLLADAVTSAGGVVVKGMGDGILARFAGAAEAVDAAVAIQQASAELGRLHGPVALRVGVAVGDVTVEDDDVFGTPVIVACRLCAEAAPGEILVADLVRAMTYGRGGHEFEERGVFDLKGIPGPVQAARVEWAAPAVDHPLTVPLPSPLGAPDSLPFAGRVLAVEVLDAGWKRACVERRQFILVSGEPGIGKTRIVTELARRVSGEGAAVLLGRCFEDIRAPYGPFLEALSHLIAHAPGALLAEHVAVAGGELARLVPDLRRRVPDVPAPLVGDPEVERLRLFEAVDDLLARTGEAAPVLVILDDLQWADVASVALLSWLATAARHSRMAIVATYRDTDVNRTHPLGRALADLRRAAGVERVSLGGLDTAEVSLLLEKAGGEPLTAETRPLVTLLEAETEGNPFFVGEVLRHFVESGVIHHDGVRWVTDRQIVESSVPEGVRDVVGRRLSALGEETNDLLRAASVLGAEFDLAVLSRVMGRPADALVDLLVEPCQRRLVLETGDIDRYRFAHALIRQTLSEELPAGRRARLHRAAADAVEALDFAAHAEIAGHLAAAGPLGDPIRAVTHAAGAAAMAADQGAWGDAALWYEQALDLDDLVPAADPLRRSRLLLALGQANNAMGQEPGALVPLAAAAELAREAGDPELFAAAACGYGGTMGVWVDPSDKQGPALLDEALAILPDGPSPSRVAVLAQRSAWEVLAVEPTQGLEFASRAVAAARVVGDDQSLFLGLRSRAYIGIWYRHDPDLAAVVDELVEVADRLGNVSDRANARGYLASLQLQRGDFPAMALTAAEEHRFSAEVGSWNNAFMAGCFLNLLRIGNGRFEEALDNLNAARRNGWTAAEALIDVSQRIWIAEIREDHDEYDRILGDGEAEHPGFLSLFPLWTIRARPWTQASNAPTLLRRWESTVRPLVPASLAPGIDAVACRAVADAPEPLLARRCYERMAPWANAWPVLVAATLFGVGDHLLGMAARAAGRLDESLEHLERGLAHHERSNLSLFVAESHLEIGRTLLERGSDGDRRMAIPHLDEATHIASERGFRRVERLASAG